MWTERLNETPERFPCRITPSVELLNKRLAKGNELALRLTYVCRASKMWCDNGHGQKAEWIAFDNPDSQVRVIVDDSTALSCCLPCYTRVVTSIERYNLPFEKCRWCITKGSNPAQPPSYYRYGDIIICLDYLSPAPGTEEVLIK